MASGLRILAVEDDPVLAGLVEYVLDREGFAVEVVGDGLAALARMDADPPNLIVLDISVPHVSGHELVERIRSSATLPRIPIVMLTGRSDTADIVRAFAAGADDYVTKPFRPEELVARIRRFFRVSA